MMVSYLLRRFSSYFARRLCLLIHHMHTAVAMRIGIPRLTHTAMMMARVPRLLEDCPAFGAEGPWGWYMLALPSSGGLFSTEHDDGGRQWDSLWNRLRVAYCWAMARWKRGGI